MESPNFLNLKYAPNSSDLPQNVCACIYHDDVVNTSTFSVDGIYQFYSHDLPNM